MTTETPEQTTGQDKPDPIETDTPSAPDLPGIVQPGDVHPEESFDDRKALVMAGPSGGLTIHPGQRKLDDEQLAALVAMTNIDPKRDPGVLVHIPAFIHMCQTRQLDPYAREAYLIPRGEGNKRTYTMQVGIDGYMKMVRLSRRFRRVVDTLWTGPEDSPEYWWRDTDGVMRRLWFDQWPESRGNPGSARTIIEHYDDDGIAVTTPGNADWSMYAPEYQAWHWGKRQGEKVYEFNEDGTPKMVLSEMWAKGKAHMVGKCSRALTCRMVAPEVTSGIYMHEEMHRLDLAERQRLQAVADERRRSAFTIAMSGKTGAVTDGSEKPAAEPVSSGPQGEPVKVGDVAGEVVQQMRATTGDPGNADAWRAELEFQASVLGVKPETVTKRDAAIFGRPYQQWTADEAAKVVVKLRLPVSARLRTTDDDTRERNGWPTPEAYMATPQDAPYVEHADGEVVPDATDDQDDGEVPQGQKHDYEDEGGLCAVPWCGEEADNVIHNELPVDGPVNQ